MSWYELLLTIHVLAAVIWVGGGTAMHILGRRVLKRGDGEEIYEFSQLWITLAFIGWGFSFLVGILYYGPQDKKLQALVAANGSTDAGVAQNVRQALMVNQVELLILFLVVVDMTTKPGL